MADDQKQEETNESKDSGESNVQEAPEASAAGDGAAADTSEVKPEVTKVDTSEVSKPAEELVKPSPKPVSANLEKIIEQIEKLSVLELADLVHALEDRFGVSASVPVATTPVATGQEAGEPQEEKTTFNVILTQSGANKISVIKAVRELVPTLGLKEAKDLVEAAPKEVLQSVNKATAEEARLKLTAAGGTVELQ